MRWLNELRRPARKCERIGHKPRGQWRRGYLPGRGGWLGGVATRVRQERDVCGRCDVELFGWTSVDGQSRTISSLTASSESWDKIDNGGWWPDGGWLAKPLFPDGTDACVGAISDEDGQRKPDTNPPPIKPEGKEVGS